MPGPGADEGRLRADQLLPVLPVLPELPEPEFPNAPVEFEMYQVPFCLTSSPVVVLLVSQCPSPHAVIRSLTSAVLDPTWDTEYDSFLIVTFSVWRSLNCLVQAVFSLGSASAQAPDQLPLWTAEAKAPMTPSGEDDPPEELPPHAARPSMAPNPTTKNTARFTPAPPRRPPWARWALERVDCPSPFSLRQMRVVPSINGASTRAVRHRCDRRSAPGSAPGPGRVGSDQAPMAQWNPGTAMSDSRQ